MLTLLSPMGSVEVFHSWKSTFYHYIFWTPVPFRTNNHTIFCCCSLFPKSLTWVDVWVMGVVWWRWIADLARRSACWGVLIREQGRGSPKMRTLGPPSFRFWAWWWDPSSNIFRRKRRKQPHKVPRSLEAPLDLPVSTMIMILRQPPRILYNTI